MSYTVTNYKTKKQLKDAVASGAVVQYLLNNNKTGNSKMNNKEDFPWPIPVNKITVTYADGTQEQYDSHSSGITDGPPRLWIDCNGGRLYIMLDKVVSYFIE